MIGIVEHWNQYLDDMQPEMQDLYFREEYVRLYETDKERAYAYVYTHEKSVLIFPFLRSTIQYKGQVFYDFETAYGYGGPVTNNIDSEFIEKALIEFKRCADHEGYVCGFVRFHPLMTNFKGLEKIGSLIFDRNTIAIDLSQGLEYAWVNEIHTKNRNVIKKGEKNGLQFVADYEFNYLEEFMNLYNATMDKLEADDFYYFANDYYCELKSKIKNKFLGVVIYEEQVIAAAIFMYEKPYGHYHLAGSDKRFLSLQPNNFLLWEAAKELYKNGVKLFHLGGGTTGDEDNSLYQYKKKFSKESHPFYIGKIIFNEEVYESLCKDWENKYPDKKERYKHYLLKYRY